MVEMVKKTKKQKKKRKTDKKSKNPTIVAYENSRKCFFCSIVCVCVCVKNNTTY